MKKITLIILCLFAYLGANAQSDTDEFKIHYGIVAGILPVKLSGITNTAANNKPPSYRRVDTTGIMGNFELLFGVNLPLYRTTNWSIGANLNAGAGRLGSFRAAEGLDSYILDFPEFLYYRNYASTIDFSVFAGFKHTRAPLNFTLPIAGFGINEENSTFLFYGSLKRDTYYSLYSNGDIHSAVKIGEFGIMYFSNF
jgi:hypothetical protein